MSPYEMMRERRAAKDAELTELLSGPTTEKRDLTEDESTKFDTLVAEIRKADERIGELEEQERRTAAAAAATLPATDTGEQRGGGAIVTDPPMYVADGGNGRSYFRDLAKAQLNGDRDAAENLQRYTRAQADSKPETRALGNTNATGGSGGEFAPPEWLVNDYIKLARAGRVTADLYTKSDVPVGVSSVNLPKVLTGTSVAIQSTQNTALSQTDLTTGSVGTGFTTLGGKQVVAQQLLDQSAINFDQVITSDLAAAYAQTVGSQVILGSGAGANNNSVINGLGNAVIPAGLQSTFTSGSPTAALFYSKAAGMLSAFVTARFAPPTVWLMHPRRFYWLVAQVDTQGRPLVVPTANGPMNAMGTHDSVTTAGNTGFTFLGLPVAIDPNVPTNLGTGTNQDEVFLLKQDDLWLFESPVRAEVFRETYADSVGVLFRLYAYAGTILNRYANSISTMNGTGLIAPTF